MTIESVRCPRCRIARTVHFGTWGRFCFNCRTTFEDAGVKPQRTPGPEVELGFTADELERLRRYRAAIRAAVYSDWPETELRLGRSADRTVRGESTRLMH
jgi:hypothetical protein